MNKAIKEGQLVNRGGGGIARILGGEKVKGHDSSRSENRRGQQHPPIGDMPTHIYAHKIFWSFLWISFRLPLSRFGCIRVRQSHPGDAMIFINHFSNAKSAQDYFTQHLSPGDYYHGKDTAEMPGVWGGQNSRDARSRLGD